MELRNTINRPTRFDEEDFAFNTVPTTAHERKTKVEHPALLKRITIGYDDSSTSTAFPSSSLLSSQPSSDNKHIVSSEGSSPVNGFHSSVLSESEDSFTTAESLPASKVNGDEGRTAESQYPVTRPTTSETHQTTSSDDVMHDMQTSPVRSSDQTIEWWMLEIGLQMYIFESLLVQFQRPDLIAEVLDLNEADLQHICYVKNVRRIHPMNVDQLWRSCAMMSSHGGKIPKSKGKGRDGKDLELLDIPPIDPIILNQYMPYFTFAEQFESATQDQKLLALQFLRQRNIEGEFVEALLRDQAGTWVRLDPPFACDTNQALARACKDQTRTERIGTTGEKDLEAEHQQEHNAATASSDAFGAVFDCPYFPSELRRQLLSRPLSELNIFESWLMYGSKPTKQSTGQAAGLPTVESVAVGQDILSSDTLHKLGVFLDEQIRSAHLHIDASDTEEIIGLVMHMLTALAVECAAIEQEAKNRPLSDEDKEAIVDAAKAQCEKNILLDFKAKISKYLPSQPSLSGGTPIAPNSKSGESGRKRRRRTKTPPQSSLRQQLELVDESRIITDAGAPNEGNDNGLQPKTRSGSVESFHTAEEDHEETLHIRDQPLDTLSGPGTPSPPDWSPVSVQGSDEEVLADLRKHTNRQASHTTSTLTRPVQRSTAWRSNLHSRAQAPQGTASGLPEAPARADSQRSHDSGQPRTGRLHKPKTNSGPLSPKNTNLIMASTSNTIGKKGTFNGSTTSRHPAKSNSDAGASQSLAEVLASSGQAVGIVEKGILPPIVGMPPTFGIYPPPLHPDLASPRPSSNSDPKHPSERNSNSASSSPKKTTTTSSTALPPSSAPSKRPRSPRKDIGKKRGPYKTQKRKAEIAAKEAAEAEA